MNIRLYLFLAVVMLFIQPEIYAQTGKIKRADRAYSKFEFLKTIDKYEKIVKKDPNNADAAKILADCYRRIGDTENAEYWYSKFAGESGASPLERLYYAQALHSNCKYDQAALHYQNYLKVMPNDVRAQNLLYGVQNLSKFSATESMWEVYNLHINTDVSEFSPVFYKDGIVFASNRGKPTGKADVWSGNSFYDLYYAEKQSNGEFREPRPLEGNINKQFHEGPATFNQSNWSEMYFTRNNYTGRKKKRSDDDIMKLKVFHASLKDNKWKEGNELPFNSNEYSVGHASLSPDGKTLFFASDMPGTLGGTDIFVSFWSDSGWSAPENLGPGVNTEGDEVFPFIHKDGTLYFASNGHAGLGGLDIFSAVKSGKSYGNVKNIGTPINSCQDDFGYVIDEDNIEGYFTSNRKGGKGDDDIYAFSRPGLMLTGIVYDKLTGDSLPGALVKIYIEGEPAREAITDEKGMFKVPVQPNLIYWAEASKAGYLPNKLKVSTEGLTNDSPPVRIPLEPESALVLKGKVIDKNTGDVIPGATVYLKDLTGAGEPVSQISGPDGQFSFGVEPGKNFELSADKPYYFLQSPVGISTVRMKAPAVIDTIIEMYYLGRAGDVIKLNNIYYDLDKWNIRPDAARELDKVVDLLKKYPDMVIQLRSHCDSRATDEYNIRLSARRAESSANYILSKGLMPGRLSSVGFGEYLLVNQCSNTVPCSEEEHQMNRRTEFKIVVPPKGANILGSYP